MWKNPKESIVYKDVEQSVTDALVAHMNNIEKPKTRPLCNAYNEADLPDINIGITMVTLGHKFLKDEGAKVEELTGEKIWEYGTATQILLDLFWEHLKIMNILDIYPGYSPLGPSLQFETGMNVTEYEPDLPARTARDKVNDILKTYKNRGVYLHPYTIDQMPAQEYDAVFCTSVVHMLADPVAGLRLLGTRVRSGGVLFITAIADDKIQDKIEAVNSMGFVTLGTPDYTSVLGKLFRCAWIKK